MTFDLDRIEEAFDRALAVLKPRGWADVRNIALCLAIGGGAGWLAVPPALPPTPVPEVTLDGKPLAIAGRDPGAILEDAREIAHAYVAREITVQVPGASVTRRRSELGARVEAGRVASLVTQLVEPQSALRRAAAQHGKRIALPLPVTIDTRRALATLLVMKDDLDRAPADAYVDLARHQLVPEQEGRRVDVYATAARLDAALVRGDAAVEAVVDHVPAARTVASIGEVSTDDVLGYFETRYNPDRKHADRSFNLRLAASKLDGHVVMPGEVFDFNEVVGARDEANGYKVAAAIANGEIVDGIGGGTCQIAGTLHGAAYFAGLPVVERRPHTRPSFYIKMGMDATVVYPTITLKLRNDFPHPIVLHETVENGVVRAEILGPKRTRDVVFTRRIEDVVPFGESEKQDAALPKGTRILAQRGIPGFKVRRDRTIRDGEKVTREHDKDEYPPTQQIWRVGTGPTDLKVTAVDDEHPEYIADEQLTIAQGPNIEDPHARRNGVRAGGPTVEARVPGRYGTRGWSIRSSERVSSHAKRAGHAVRSR
ncbi:MAG: VanW family protein [Labilithrix sp.]|nr:VanW family protein [Labilithrix sp.]MCW5816848.1 VanW family protein [Labilithrix sp.]